MFYLLLFGLLVFLVGYLGVAQAIGKRRGLIWGFLFLPFPVIAFVFGVGEWKRLKRPVIILSIGLPIVLVGLLAGGMKEAKTVLTQYGFEEAVERITYQTNLAQEYVFGVSSTPPRSKPTQPNPTQNRANALTSPDQTDENLPPQGVRLVNPSKFVYQQRSIDSAERYLGYRVQVHLNSGLIREATLVKKNQSRVMLKHQIHSGYIAYEIPMTIIRDFYVQLPLAEERE